MPVVYLVLIGKHMVNIPYYQLKKEININSPRSSCRDKLTWTNQVDPNIQDLGRGREKEFIKIVK